MIINDKRALAYTVQIDNIEPIVGADNIEMATVGGWKVIVKKGEFVPKETAVFFEIDSKLPEEERYAFMARKHYAVKSMKLNKFGVISQGLLMPLSEFPELGTFKNPDVGVIDNNIDLTDVLRITYNVPEDNKRKSSPSKEAKYQSMAARHQKIFRQKWARWMMRRNWGRKFMFFFFGRKKDNPKYFPKEFEFVHPTDEERVENIPYILNDEEPWIKTLKIDGTSTTFILARKKHKKLWDKEPYEFIVCSRNVRQFSPDQECFHESNVYWEMAEKYNIKKVLTELLVSHREWDYVALQGETAGEGVQGNPHKLAERNFYGFNFITSDRGRWNSVQSRDIFATYNIPWVPIVDENYYLPKNMEEFKLSADGPCELEGASGLREGYVYRSQDGKRSFKNVSRTYLLSKGE